MAPPAPLSLWALLNALETPSAAGALDEALRASPNGHPTWWRCLQPEARTVLGVICAHEDPSLRHTLIERLGKAFPPGHDIWTLGLLNTLPAGVAEWEFVKERGGKIPNPLRSRKLLPMAATAGDRNGDAGLLRHLLSHSDREPSHVNQCTIQLAWHDAVSCVMPAAMQALLEAGADPREEYKSPPLTRVLAWALSVHSRGGMTEAWRRAVEDAFALLAPTADWQKVQTWIDAEDTEVNRRRLEGLSEFRSMLERARLHARLPPARAPRSLRL